MSIFVKLIKSRVDITQIVAYSYQFAEQKQKPAVFIMLKNEPKRFSLLCDTDEQVNACIKKLDQLLNTVNDEPDTTGYHINPLWEHCQYVSIAELRKTEKELDEAHERIAQLELALNEIRSGKSINPVVEGGAK